MKKKILIAISYVLILALGIAGTVAYFTDRDAEVNVFTVGNVDIELKEKFEQGAELLPGVKVKKEATIINTGDNDAWVWMTLAVPAALDDEDPNTTGENNYLHWNMPGCFWYGYHNQQKFINSGIANGYLSAGSVGVADEDAWINSNDCIGQQTIGEITYNLYAFLYKGVLVPDEETNIALSEVYLDQNVDMTPDGKFYYVKNGTVEPIEWNLKENGAPKVYVAAYAIQAENFQTVEEAYAAYGKQWGSNTNAEYTEPSDEKVTELKPEDLVNVQTLTEGTYALSGNFENITLTVDELANVTIDGTNAKFGEKSVVTVKAPGVAHSYSSLNAERKGNVTIKGIEADVLNVLAYNNESVVISGNTLKAMSVIGGNFALTIDGNTVDGDFGKYTDGESQTNDYGISMRITDYELSLTNNTITDTYSHAIGINGRQGEQASDWGDCGENNEIVAFSGNNITVNTTYKTERAALKIWCDQVYAPYATSGHEPNAAAKALMAAIKADTTNVFTLGDGHTTFNIFDYKK